MLSKRTLLSAVAGLAMLAIPAIALAGGPYTHGWHDQGWHRGWYKHFDRDDSRPAWGTHRFYAPPVARYHHEPDADDFRSNQRYWGGYNYDRPISSYNAIPQSGYSLAQQRNLVIQRRIQATRLINDLRARGDSRGAARMTVVLQNLNTRLVTINRRMGYGYDRYTPTANPYVQAPYSYGYTPYYGNPGPYANSDPMVSTLTTLAAPLLDMQY